MAYTIVGTIISIGAPVTLSSKSGATFTKRELVLAAQKFDPNTGEPYSDQSNTPVFTFMGDAGRDLDPYQIGQMVKVSFALSGRTYVDATGATRYINDVRGHRVEPYVRYGVPSYATSQVPEASAQSTTPPTQESAGDGLPF